VIDSVDPPLAESVANSEVAVENVLAQLSCLSLLKLCMLRGSKFEILSCGRTSESGAHKIFVWPEPILRHYCISVEIWSFS
jgi:hypothetical protein